MSKPTNKPGWNPSDPSKVVEPNSTKKAQGWAAGEKPAAEHFNWLMKNLSDWVDYFDTAPVNSSVYASFAGTLIPTTGTMRWKPRNNVTITNVKMTVGIAPTSPLAVDILKNGVSVFSGSYPTIASGSLESLDFSLNVSVLTTDYITVNINSGNGQDLSVRIDYSY